VPFDVTNNGALGCDNGNNGGQRGRRHAQLAGVSISEVLTLNNTGINMAVPSRR